MTLSAGCHGLSSIAGHPLGSPGSRSTVLHPELHCVRGLENLVLTGLDYLINLATLVVCTQPKSRLLKHINMKFVVPGPSIGVVVCLPHDTKTYTKIFQVPREHAIGQRKVELPCIENIGNRMIKMTCLDDSCLDRALLSNKLRTPGNLA